MALFKSGKNKEEEKKSTDKKGERGVQNTSSIKVLGSGCKSCHRQYENAREAVSDMGIDAEVEYITDMEKIITYGAMSMPALVVNEKVVSTGKIMKKEEIKKLLDKMEQTC